MVRKATMGERIFNLFNICVTFIISLLCLYPFLYVLFSSLSEGGKLIRHQGLLLAPQGFSLDAYRIVLTNPYIFSGYANTLFILVVGVSVNLVMTSFGAYFLSRKNVLLKKPIMMFIVFTMFLNGGLVPFFLTIKGLGLYNSLWALIVPVSINTFNLIIMRTYFLSIPDSMEESAVIDGAGQFTILFRIYLPLSMPVIAVMILYYGVGHWNSWFNAMIFLSDRDLFPLQLILREILIAGSALDVLASTGYINIQEVEETIKHTAIIIATLPILFVYPFLQKYFVKGVMIGALKG